MAPVTIEVKKNILHNNERRAADLRQALREHQVCMVNIMAAPGAGKTSAIMTVIEALGSNIRMAVIEGDIAADVDALQIETMGVPAIQINTAGACHLTASMAASALEHLKLSTLDLIIIENVGNLVCPAEFDLGENYKVMISSVTEGHDKPQKYPVMFREVDAVLVNKVDLMPYCDFDLVKFRQQVKMLNVRAPVIELSCRNGTGTGSWQSWIKKAVNSVKAAAPGDAP